MRIRRNNALLIMILFVLGMFALYLMLDRSMTDRISQESNSGIVEVEREVNAIEEEIRSNHKTLDLIRQVLKDLGDIRMYAGGKKVDTNKLVSVRELSNHLAEVNRLRSQGWRERDRPVELRLSNTTCPKDVQAALSDIQMMNIFDKLLFDNPDGGVWKQGWPISYNAESFEGKKLRVFIVPHSHNDPGWRKTVDDYFRSETIHILNGMLEFLPKHKDMRFIYAEMIFFSMWWKELDEQHRSIVKSLLQEGRLEIVTGGWVMNDEANTNFFAMVDQLFEGHRFMMDELKVQPNVSWSIDPFGHSPIMAHLLRKAGFHSMLIQRVHYSIKKILAKRNMLEFIWRQHWDVTGGSDIFTHMMPFYSYDVPHTCGPDPSICCQFDFARLPGFNHKCPWNVVPQEVDNSNIDERAFALLDQYRKKSTLYKNNVVLIPLGDDFRYASEGEWSAQYRNYARLIKYMNSKTKWNVEARFATLSDYFNAVREEAGLNYQDVHSLPEDNLPKGFPWLVGDMFTYADRDDHYWSGYYTSRPYHKHLERYLEARLRAAEIVFTLACVHAKKQKRSFSEKRIFDWLVDARQQLAVFQHHDGITGTGKAHVMEDYGKRMLMGLKKAQKSLALSAYFILAVTVDKDKERFDGIDDKTNYALEQDYTWRTLYDIPEPEKLTMKANDVRHIVFFNPLAQMRETLVTLWVTYPHLEVRTPGNQLVVCQVEPIFRDVNFKEDMFQLRFSVQAGPLAFERFTLRAVDSESGCPKADVTLMEPERRTEEIPPTSRFPFLIRVRPKEAFTIDNTRIKLYGDDSGFLKSVEVEGGATARKLDLKLGMVEYGARTSKERSGAYLFLPDGKGKRIKDSNKRKIIITKGPIVQEVRTIENGFQHVVRLLSTKGTDAMAIHIDNYVNIRDRENTEWAMRIEASKDWLDNRPPWRSDGRKQPEFFTDLNCYQMIRREAWKQLPLQANVYPMPCASMMEDRGKGMRLSVLSAQPLGVGAQTDTYHSQLDIFLDRRLNQDDNRGLGEGVTDNRLTHSGFRLLIETLSESPGAEKSRPSDHSFLTASGHLLLYDFLHPLLPLVVRADLDAPTRLVSSFSLLTGSGLNCDLHLLNLKWLGGDASLILHRTQFDCRQRITHGAQCSVAATKADEHILVTALFNDLIVENVERTTLTMLKSKGHVAANRVLIKPMDLETFRLKFKS